MKKFRQIASKLEINKGEGQGSYEKMMKSLESPWMSEVLEHIEQEDLDINEFAEMIKEMSIE